MYAELMEEGLVEVRVQVVTPWQFFRDKKISHTFQHYRVLERGVARLRGYFHGETGTARERLAK